MRCIEVLSGMVACAAVCHNPYFGPAGAVQEPVAGAQRPRGGNPGAPAVLDDDLDA